MNVGMTVSSGFVVKRRQSGGSKFTGEKCHFGGLARRLRPGLFGWNLLRGEVPPSRRQYHDHRAATAALIP
jgi:hypothetical protein